jgi:mono/diheme cytochrome c family protein
MSEALRRILIGLIVVAVVAGLPALAVFLGLFQRSVVEPSVEQPLSPEAMRALVPKGRYLVFAADCYACHTMREGPPWVGGRPFATPLGTIYATNISPDKETGIGNWTRADFHRAVRDGLGKHGYLYPVMSYTSYRLLTADDVDAMYAYIMSREPIHLANTPTTIPFPLDIRQFMTFWNFLNLRGGPMQPDPARSAAWNRGRYMVDALGHCGECHTPRDLMMAMQPSKYLQGAVIEGVEAPNITSPALAALGFDHTGLARFMKAGLSPQGAMTYQMFEVVHYSTQYMNDDDLAAMATYLLDKETAPPKPVAPVAVAPELASAGRNLYLDVCSGCHGAEGEGIPHVSVPMDTNATLRLSSPRNFLRTVLQGLPEQDFPGLERMQPMPGFADRLTDRQIADLANWMRARWGGRQPDITPQGVEAMVRR